MHKEVSMAVEIGVALMALAAIIGIIWFTVFLGKDMAGNASFEASEIMAKTEVATLESISDRDGVEMPLATAYTILRMNSQEIPKFICTCDSCAKYGIEQNLTKNSPCVLGHLNNTMRVIMTVDLDDSGAYVVKITDVK